MPAFLARRVCPPRTTPAQPRAAVRLYLVAETPAEVIDGTAGPTETPDAGAGVAATAIAGSLAAGDGADQSAILAEVTAAPITGDSAGAESPDSGLITATLSVEGPQAAIEATDAPAGIGGVGLAASLAGTEAGDVSGAATVLANTVLATLVQPGDLASFFVFAPPIIILTGACYARDRASITATATPIWNPPEPVSYRAWVSPPMTLATWVPPASAPPVAWAEPPAPAPPPPWTVPTTTPTAWTAPAPSGSDDWR